MQDREHEPQVGRDRRLRGQEVLDPLLDLQVDRVDLIVESDHLLGRLVVRVVEGRQGEPERAHDQIALELEPHLETLELPVELVPHPKRPVT